MVSDPSARLPVADASDAVIEHPILTFIKSPWLWLSVILATTFALYAPILDDWFQTDDFFLLRAATIVPFPTYVREAFDFRDFEPLRFFAYRPLFYVTNDAMFQAFGLNALPYHLISIFLHMLNVVLVWFIARRTTNSNLVAHTAALIFGLHPVYATTVTWISTQNLVMATTGQLIAALAFIEFMRHGHKRWLAVSVVTYGAAILYHQDVFLLPAALGIYFLATRLDDIPGAIRSAAVVFTPFALVLGAFLIVQGWNSSESGYIDNFVPNWNLARTYFGVLGMAILPIFETSPTEYIPNAPDIAGFGWIQILGSLIAISGAAVVYWLRPERRPVIVFAIVWYHASLFLSELFLGDADPVPLMARKIYAAGPAIGILAGIAIETAWLRLHSITTADVKPILYSVLGMLAVLAIVVTFMRAGHMRDDIEPLAIASHDFLEDLQEAHPELPAGGTLYVAGAPLALQLFCDLAPDSCYLPVSIELYYDDIAVERISNADARDPSFIASLGPNDRIFCWRCGPP